MSLPSLYTLSSQYQSLKALALSDEIDPQTLADTLEGLTGDLTTKGANVAAFALNLAAMRDMLTEASRKLAERAQVADNHYERVRAYLFANMQAAGVSKIVSAELIASIKKNPPAVNVLDESAVPAKFRVQPEPPPPKLDRKAIGAALKAGEDVPGCALVQGERLDIR